MSQSHLTEVEVFYLSDFNIKGDVLIDNGDVAIKFLPSNLRLFNEKWEVQENNYIRFGKNKVSIQDFELDSGKRSIKIYTENEKDNYSRSKKWIHVLRLIICNIVKSCIHNKNSTHLLI